MREQVVRNAKRQSAIRVELLDDGVVIGIILKAAARVDDAGNTEGVQFSHEMPGGIELVIFAQLRPLRQRGVQDRGIGLRQKKSRRITGRIANDFSTGRVRGVLAVPDRSQCGCVEQRTVIKM